MSSFEQGLTPPAPQGDVEWTLEGYLERMNLDHLKMAIKHYKQGARKRKKRTQIRSALSKVFSVPGLANVVMPFRYSQIPEGTNLFRARVISEPGQIGTESDVWMAPPSFIGAGRLNDVGEPLLYTAANPVTALHEVRAKPGDLVAVTHFRVVNAFLAINLSASIDEPSFSFLSQRKLGIMTQFVEDVFTQEIPSDETHRYIAPDLLAKEYFNMPTKLDGWIYRSVADPRIEIFSAVNTCIRGERARNLLRYVKTDIVEIASFDLIGPHRRLRSLGPGEGTNELLPVICQGSIPTATIPDRSALTFSIPAGPGMGEVATLLERRSQSPQAAAQFERVAGEFPATSLAELGARYKEQGRLAEAEELFRKSACRGNNLGATYLGVLLAERGHVAEAEVFLRVAADNQFAFGLRCLGVLLARLGRVTEAEAAYRAAAVQGDVQSMSNLGASLSTRGHIAKAESFYREAAARGSAHAKYGLAQLVFDRGRAEEAEALLEESVALGHPEALMWKGYSLVKSGERDEGADLLRRAAAAGDVAAAEYLRELVEDQ